MAHAHSGGRGQGHRQRSTSGRWAGWSRPYRWGSTGYGGDTYDPDLVSSVQACLAQTVGPWVPQNGRLGRATRHALRAFQSQQGLPVNGVPDPDTVAQLQKSCGGHHASDGGTQPVSPDGPADSGSGMNGEVFALSRAHQANNDMHDALHLAPPNAARHGRWFRHQDRIVVLLNRPSAREDREVADAPNADTTAMRAAIQRGVRDENRLTDMIFNAHHPERRGQRLQASERDLGREWLLIRSQIVRPELGAPTPAGAAAAPPAAQPASTTSGVEAAGNTTHIIQCLQGLRDQGRSIRFVQRYLRDLTRAEVTALRNAGFQIVSCFEEGNATNMAYFTRAQGQHDARRGFTQAQAVGQPAGKPVYFAIDTDPDVRQRQVILDYAQGLRDGFTQYLADMKAQNKQPVNYAIGIYGSGCVLSWCQAQGIATWFWQAFAPGWCNNRNLWPGANIHTSGRDIPERCGWRLGHLEGWGNEGGW